MGVGPTVVLSATIWNNKLKEHEFRHFPGIRDSLQKAHFVKSCVANTRDLRGFDRLYWGIQQAKCKKSLDLPRNGG